jgi:hypothetical protein
VIAALNDSYALFRPGEVPLMGGRKRHKYHRHRCVPHRRAARGAVPGVRTVVQLRPWRSFAADAANASAFRLSILVGFLILLPVLGAMMMAFLAYVEGVLHLLTPSS